MQRRKPAGKLGCLKHQPLMLRLFIQHAHKHKGNPLLLILSPRWVVWIETSFKYSTTVNYCWLTVKDKSIPSLSLCCWLLQRQHNSVFFLGAQNSLSAPLCFFSARAIYRGSRRRISTVWAKILAACIISFKLGAICSCICLPPQQKKSKVFEWHRQWI